jgi:tetratricopeptide (TPR) repeat protein
MGGFAWAQGSTDDVATWLRDGNFYYAQGDCALAQYFFQEALKRDEANVEALVGKGRALGCQGAFGSAVEAFRGDRADAATCPPRAARARVPEPVPGRPQTFGGTPGRGDRRARRAEPLAPQDATVQNTKGIIYYEGGNLEQARVTLERASSSPRRPA